MSGPDFLQKLKGISNLELVKESEEAYIVLNHNNSKKYQIQKTAVTQTDWQNISSILEGREPIVLDGITRIVGYFSKVSNWNKSKLGELKDRRKGNYKVGSC